MCSQKTTEAEIKKGGDRTEGEDDEDDDEEEDDEG